MALLAMRCQGYKAFAEPTELPLRPITVIFGRNNSGKTSLVRLPIFASASITNNQNMYVLSSDGIRFGSSFRDLASTNQPHPRMSFGLSWEPGYSLTAGLQYLATQGREESIRPATLQIDDDVRAEFNLRRSEGDSAFAQMNTQLSRPIQQRFAAHRRHLARLLRTTIHIPSSRPELREIYQLRDARSWSVSEVPYLLAQHGPLLDWVDGWYRKQIDRTGVEAEYGGFAFRLVTQPTKGANALPVNLAEAGRGTQSVLPVATLLMGIAKQLHRARLIIIEEPEAHLHPSAHGATADLAIDCSEQSQVLVETHSEHFILRLRRRIAEGQLSPANLALYYVGADHSVQAIQIDDQGVASNWPSGVFEYDVEEAQAIVQARLATMQHDAP